MEVWSHLRTIGVLMEQTCCDGWRFLGIGSALQVQVFDDRVDELWLHQHDGPILMVLYLNAQKIANITLIINGEMEGAGTQVGNDLIDGLTAWTKNDAVVNINQEHYGPMVV